MATPQTLCSRLPNVEFDRPHLQNNPRNLPKLTPQVRHPGINCILLRISASRSRFIKPNTRDDLYPFHAVPIYGNLLLPAYHGMLDHHCLKHVQNTYHVYTITLDLLIHRPVLKLMPAGQGAHLDGKGDEAHPLADSKPPMDELPQLHPSQQKLPA
jgi:hypothetical protein